MKLLLHTCCGPCFIYPYRTLQDQGFEVAGYFYNPNIHPFSEYNNRRAAIEKIAQDVEAEVISPEYDFEEFFWAIEKNTASPARCKKCWQLRLIKTAECAKEKGYDSFSTTLLVSPYQDIEAIKEIGSSVADNTGIQFHFQDFRPGFKAAHQEARVKGIYCQKYCGCLYSEKERYQKKKK
ncbi:epoxyqueuosine reductase QueH [Candidatus Omnitrophota bacterium]